MSETRIGPNALAGRLRIASAAVAEIIWSRSRTQRVSWARHLSASPGIVADCRCNACAAGAETAWNSYADTWLSCMLVSILSEITIAIAVSYVYMTDLGVPANVGVVPANVGNGQK